MANPSGRRVSDDDSLAALLGGVEDRFAHIEDVRTTGINRP